MTGFWRIPVGRRYRAIVALALAVALVACGRKGDPLPPPDPSATATPKANSQIDNPVGLGMSPPDNPPIQRPKQPFFLDPLLK